MIFLNIEVNYMSVLIAGVASMAIGFAWYSQALFGKSWMKLKGYSVDSMKAAQKEMGKLYALSFVASLVTAYVLTHVMVMSQNFYHYEDLSTGLVAAFWMWLGFIIPTQLTATIFGEKKWQLLAIDTGYQLAAVLSMGAVIGYFGI